MLLVALVFHSGCDKDLFKARTHTLGARSRGVIGHRHVAGVLVIPSQHTRA